jgi:hypothetical protein
MKLFLIKIFLTVDFINVNLKISYSILWYFVNLSSLPVQISNCQILGSDLTRVEFVTLVLQVVNLSKLTWASSSFTNPIRNKFEEILLIGLILSDLKIKTTTFHDLEFSKTYPVRIHKLKKVREVSDRIVSRNFSRLLFWIKFYTTRIFIESLLWPLM